MTTDADELTTNGLRVLRAIFINDLISGLVNAIVTIPGGLANGVLAVSQGRSELTTSDTKI